MSIPNIVENCPVCDPIKSLLNTLVDKGFNIIEQKCSDFHFHELLFRLESIGDAKDDNISLTKICKHENGFYYCECHWSKVIIE